MNPMSDTETIVGTTGAQLCAALGLDPTHINTITFEPAAAGSIIVAVQSHYFMPDIGAVVDFLSNYRLVRIEEPGDD